MRCPRHRIMIIEREIHTRALTHQQKDSKSKGSGKVSVSCGLHDVITHHNTRLVFCHFYNQRLGDMEVKQNKQWDHILLNLLICNITLQLPFICWQDNSRNMLDFTTRSHTWQTTWSLQHLQQTIFSKTLLGFSQAAVYSSLVVM